MPTKHSDEGFYKFSMNFLREAENHCVLQSPIPITCPVRLIHGLKDEDVPWHISMQVAERVLSPDVDVILRRHGHHRMSDKDDIKLMVYTIDDLIDKLTTMVWVSCGGASLSGWIKRMTANWEVRPQGNYQTTACFSAKYDLLSISVLPCSSFMFTCRYSVNYIERELSCYALPYVFRSHLYVLQVAVLSEMLVSRY